MDNRAGSKSMSRLTFAIPVYERDSYFEQALDSALNQTVAARIVVVDNGSSHDRFREIVAAKGSARVRFYKNQTNLGMFANWNLAARYAETEFVMILGDDDYVLPNYAEEFERALDAHPDIDAYYTGIRWFSAEPMAFPSYTYPVGYQAGRTMLEFAAEHGLGIPSTSLCLRRSLFDGRGFLERPHGNSDWLFAYEALNASAVFGNPELLAGYRKHPESDTLSGDTAMVTAVSCVYIYWRIGELLDEAGSTFFAKKARGRARELSINLGINWGARYGTWLANAPADHLYVQFLKKVIFPTEPLARALASPHRYRLLILLIARIRRKSLFMAQRLRAVINRKRVSP